MQLNIIILIYVCDMHTDPMFSPDIYDRIVRGLWSTGNAVELFGVIL